MTSNFTPGVTECFQRYGEELDIIELIVQHVRIRSYFEFSEIQCTGKFNIMELIVEYVRGYIS